MSSRHGRTKQYGPDSGAYPKLPPPHGNNTYNGRMHQHHLQQQQQQHHLQHINQHQQYAVDLQPNMRGTLPRQNHHHHSLPRNAWSVDRHSPGSSTNSSNEKGFQTANHIHSQQQQQYRRSNRHRVYSSQRQIASKSRSHKGGGTTTSDPDALSSVTTAGNKFSHHPMGVWTEPPAPVMQQTATAPSPPSPIAMQPQFVPPLPPQNVAPYPIGPCIATAPTTTTVRQPSSVAPAMTVRLQPTVIMPACDVAVDACGGRCPRFENFCHFCLLIFYFSGITIGFMLIMSAIVSTRDPRFLYIGCLMLPVSAFLLAVQCRVRQDADRRKRHRQLNSRHRTIGASAMVVNTHPPSVPDAIPLQNMIMVGGGNDTLRRQYQGHVYQYVGQKDNESTYTNQYDSASVQQIDGVPWWRRDDNRVYHNNHTPHS